METQVRTPQMVFMQPQRLVVPLFQRPYVWNEENQWEPLWNDVVRVADIRRSRRHRRASDEWLGVFPDGPGFPSLAPHCTARLRQRDGC